jgi:hypothetical protein
MERKNRRKEELQMLAARLRGCAALCEQEKFGDNKHEFDGQKRVTV